MSDFKLTKDNYTSLFGKSFSIVASMSEYYPLVVPDFNNKLSLYMNTFCEYGIKNDVNDNLFKDKFKFNELAEGDNANRQVIFALSDAYFISCIWYNSFKLFTKYKDKDSKTIGQANDQLAEYTKDLIHLYSTHKATRRDIKPAIGSAWLTYEELVSKSLSYSTWYDLNTYRGLVNTALNTKLGLESIYTMEEQDGIHTTNKG